MRTRRILMASRPCRRRSPAHNLGSSQPCGVRAPIEPNCAVRHAMRDLQIAGVPVLSQGPRRDEAVAMNTEKRKRSGWSWWYLLFVIQFVVILWPPFYNKVEPTLIGIPFFYWFQLLWVLVSAVFTAVIYFATDK